MTKWAVQIGWGDIPHLPDDAKAQMLESIPPQLRDARTKGIPQLGAGAIYPVPEQEILCEPFKIPPWYRRAYGFDVGWNRTAAIWGAIDPESDVCYLYREYYRGMAEPPVHAQGIRAAGEWIPGVIDPASHGRNQLDGEQLFRQYQELGLILRNANNAVESGIYEVWMRLSSGRLKVFKGRCPSWLSEYRIYRRDERGKVVKQNDHLMDCTRYLVMSGIPIAAQDPRGLDKIARRIGHQSDYNPFAGM